MALLMAFSCCDLHQDDAAARAAQALVGGGGDHVGVGHGVGVDAGGDQAGVVRHVHQEDRAHVFGHLGETLEIDAQAVGRGAGDDQLGLGFVGLFLHRVVVDGFVGVQPVADHVEPLAAHVQRHAVGEVAAFGQAHAHDGVAGLQKGEKHGLVGRCAAMGLHVGSVGTEQLLHAVDGELLGHVNVLTAAVVAAAWIAFGVFVGELGTLRGHHGGRGVVFAGDQLDVVFLASVLKLDGGKQFGIGLLNEDVAVVHGGSAWWRDPDVNPLISGCPGERLNGAAHICWDGDGALPSGCPDHHLQIGWVGGPRQRTPPMVFRTRLGKSPIASCARLNFTRGFQPPAV